MTSRRENFRSYMSAFDGSDFESAFKLGWYVERPGNPVVHDVCAAIELDSVAQQALIGSIGAGKSTQMLAVATRLAQVDDEFVWFADVAKVHDLAHLGPSVLLTIAGIVIGKALADSKESAVRAAATKLEVHAGGHWDEPDYDSEYEGEHWVPGVIRDPKPVDVQVARIEEAVATLVQALGKKPVVLLDGLDRVDRGEAQALRTMLTQDLCALRRVGVGCVLVLPQWMLLGDDREWLDEYLPRWHVLPPIDVDRTPGMVFLADVLRKRSPEGMMPPSAADKIAELSGGVMRDLISLARAAGESAYLDGRTEVTEDDAARAANGLARRRLFGLGNAELARLRQVDGGTEFLPASESDIRLLMTGCILQRVSLTTRYVVHPALRRLLTARRAA